MFFARLFTNDTSNRIVVDCIRWWQERALTLPILVVRRQLEMFKSNTLLTRSRLRIPRWSGAGAV